LWGRVVYVSIRSVPFSSQIHVKQSFQRPESDLMSTPWLSRVQDSHFTKKENCRNIAWWRWKTIMLISVCTFENILFSIAWFHTKILLVVNDDWSLNMCDRKQLLAKGTVSLISIDLPCKITMPDYKDTIEPGSKYVRYGRFLLKKCLFLWVSPSLLINKKFASHFRRECTDENKSWKKIKDWYASRENRICIRVEFTRKKCKTAILLYCFHTAGVLHIFVLYKLLGPGTSFYRKSKINIKSRVSTKWLNLLRKICAIFAQIFFCELLRYFCAWNAMSFARFCGIFAKVAHETKF